MNRRAILVIPKIHALKKKNGERNRRVKSKNVYSKKKFMKSKPGDIFRKKKRLFLCVFLSEVR